MIWALVWKEWREQRWKLGFGGVMLASFTGSLLAARLTTPDEAVLVIWVLGGGLLALYSAMGVFATERSEGTTLFLAAKPVAGWQVFWCKWVMGWVNFAVPMLGCSLLVWLLADFAGGGRSSQIAAVASGGVKMMLLATTFYTLTCCLAPRRCGEAGVGLVGLLVVLGMALHAMGVMWFCRVGVAATEWRGGMVGEVLTLMNPMMWFDFIKPVPGHEGLLWLFLLEQGVLMAVVLWVGMRKWVRSF